MHGPRRAAVSLVLVAVVVTHAAAQARDGLPATDGTAEQPPPQPFQTLDGSKKPLRRQDIFTPKTKPLNLQETPVDLETIGDKVVEQPDGPRWDIRGRTYAIEVTPGGRPLRKGRVTGVDLQGGQRQFIKQVSDGVEAAQTIWDGGYGFQGSATMEGPGEGEVSMIGGGDGHNHFFKLFR